MKHFSYHEGELHAEAVAISTLAKQVATPFYLYSTAALKQNFYDFKTALHHTRKNALRARSTLIAYAVKANSNMAVLRLLAREGAGADVVSQGELRRALGAGIAPQKIVFSGVGKSADEMDFALGHGILCFNLESVPELHLLNARAQALGVKAPISLRINPDIEAGSHAKISTGRAEDKFGIAYAQARSLYHEAAQMRGIEIKGIDIHIGSQICDLAPFDKAFGAIAELVKILRQDGHNIHHIDVGGGLGIDYFNGETPPSVENYTNLIAHHFDALEVDIISEPGRQLVGNAGILVSSVLYCKQTEHKNFVIVDAAMNDLIRPTLYEARHKIIPVRKAAEDCAKIRADIVGPVCESGDYLGKDLLIALPHAGDLLVMMSAGAYGAVMASTYNTRLLVPELLVSGNDFDIVRRRPSFEEMLVLEQMPDWLI